MTIPSTQSVHNHPVLHVYEQTDHPAVASLSARKHSQPCSAD